MNTTTRRTARVLTLSAFTVATAIPALPAIAKDGDIIRRGDCSKATDWKLKASEEDGRIEVEAEIDSNVNGQTWTWTLKHNGSVSAKGTSTTKAPSGSFEVRRVVVNLQGPDYLVFRSTNPKTGEVCRGSVTY